MKVAIVNYSDINGGAARAAWRIHHALRSSGIDSSMYVDELLSGELDIVGYNNVSYKLKNKLKSIVSREFTGFLKTSNMVLHSPALFSSQWVDDLNNSDADIIHLHWVNNEMMSINDIGKIKKPCVWTLHDMWAFCGAEHYTEDYRWRDGYQNTNRPDYESGFDLNKWTWKRKISHWSNPIHIVTPSHWLAECVKQSKLMHSWPVTVIPNALDIDHWKPVDKNLARSLLNLPLNCSILTFGAIGGSKDPRKGIDLLKAALDSLRGEISDLQLVIFGEHAPRDIPDFGFPVHYMGHLHDDISLRVLYSAADAMLIPSRQDNLPNTGVEALACGTPVIAFNTCGLSDIVDHQQTGWLAKAFDVNDLAQGIKWVLSDKTRHKKLQLNARAGAVARFAYPVVAETHNKLYESILYK